MKLHRQLGSDDLLYFLHIERTGGTTFGLYLISNFADSQIFPHSRSWRAYFDFPPIDFTNIRYVVGHLGYRFYRYLPRKPVYITMLRDPISRWLSMWQHMKEKSVVSDSKSEFFQSLSIAEGLKFEPLRYRMTNSMVRSIALDPADEAFRRLGEKTNYDDSWFTNITLDDMYYGLSEREVLEIAKRRLESEFAFFGLTERYQESFFLLAHTFGWRPVKQFTIKNAMASTRKKETLPQQLLDEIANVNNLDIELYEYAKTLFDQRFKQMIDELKAKYHSSEHETFDMVYDMLDQQYDERFKTSHNFTDTLDYTFDQPLHGDGWDVIEKDANGKIYRWTGPQTESTINLPLKKDNDLMLTISISSAITPEVLASLKVEVNGDIIEGSVKDRTYRGKIKSKSLKKGNRSYTKLVFRVDKTVSPVSLSRSRDPRLIGIAINQITITPAS